MTDQPRAGRVAPVTLDASYKTDANGMGYLDDGFGNCWLVCHDVRCDLQIVRPGKVQCSNYCMDSDIEEGSEFDGPICI